MMISTLIRLKARPMALDYALCLVLASGLGGMKGQINEKYRPAAEHAHVTRR